MEREGAKHATYYDHRRFVKEGEHGVVFMKPRDKNSPAVPPKNPKRSHGRSPLRKKRRSSHVSDDEEEDFEAPPEKTPAENEEVLKCWNLKVVVESQGALGPGVVVDGLGTLCLYAAGV